MASLKCNEVTSGESPRDTCKKTHLSVSKGRQEVSGIDAGLVGQASAPRKRHTHGSTEPRETTKNPFQLSSDQPPPPSKPGAKL